MKETYEEQFGLVNTDVTLPLYRKKQLVGYCNELLKLLFFQFIFINLLVSFTVNMLETS